MARFPLCTATENGKACREAFDERSMTGAFALSPRVVGGSGASCPHTGRGEGAARGSADDRAADLNGASLS
jgi:hypothetical protein